MQPLVTSAQMREIDRRAISEIGLPELLLMEHAALGVVRSLQKRFHGTFNQTRGVILAGTGNNGGDALAVARIIDSLGLKKLFVALIGSDKSLSPAAKTQIEILGRLGVPVFRPKKIDQEVFESCDWVVDGLFGTGLSRDVKEPYHSLIGRINEYSGRRWIVSIDVPSGLNSDTGHPMGCAVKASETITLGFIKRGLVTGPAADYVGILTVESIQIPRIIPFVVGSFLYGIEDAVKLPYRRPASHKGTYGHVYIWASEEDKEGACILSSLGALRSGAGLVTLVGSKEHLGSLRKRLPPEVMTQVADESIFKKNSGVWVIGPGMGTKGKTAESGLILLEKAIEAHWKCILDADVLNWISSHSKQMISMFKKTKPDQLILTPHPKEAGRLLGIDVDEVEKDRYESVHQLSQKFKATIVLKGKGTLVQVPNHPCIAVCSGDTGLSKGGTGDLLTGILGALMAQGLSTELGIPLGVYIHGKISERISQKFGHPRSTLASDLAAQIPEVFRELEQS